MRPIIAASILGLALIIKLVYQSIFNVSHQGIPPTIPLDQFPWGVVGGGWSENRQPLEERVERIAGIDDYLNCVFTKHRQSPIWLYVGYYDGSSLESMHQPEICFPGAGWRAQNKRVETFLVPGLDNVYFNVLEFKKNQQLRLTAFTFYYEGEFQPDQFYVERGRIFGERHFAIITTATNVSESIEHSRRDLEELLSSVIPKLLKHLPSSN